MFSSLRAVGITNQKIRRISGSGKALQNNGGEFRRAEKGVAHLFFNAIQEELAVQVVDLVLENARQ